MPASRLSIRLRSALAASLTAALAFTAGAWWLRHELYTSKMADARNQARATLNVIEPRYSRGGDPVYFPGTDTWIVVDPLGKLVEGNPNLLLFVPGPLGPASAEPRNTIFTERTVHLGGASGSPSADVRRLANHDFTVLTTVFAGRGLQDLDGSIPTVNLTLHVLVPPWDAEEAVDAVDRVLYIGIPAAVLLVALIVWFTTSRALRPVSDIQQRLRTITAHNLSLRVPVPPRQDEIARLAATTNDALDRLERAVEEQRRFTADASHELRTPLAALRADLEVALHYPERTDWPKVVGDTVGDTIRLQQLADDLLLLADLDNRTPRHAHPVDLGAVVREATARAGRHVPPSVRVECRTTGATVMGDRRQLERLLDNLVGNAVRHARGLVTVEVTTGPARTVHVEVVDDGPGIPVQDRERVFERFTRLDPSRARDTGGTGLGLPIAREIARSHGGTLAAEASPNADGARFVAVLPALSVPA